METERMYPSINLYEYAMRLVGTPYIWGGSNPVAGLDCSGFVIELLQSVGVFPSGMDASAAKLAEYFSKFPVEGPSFGHLVFFGSLAPVQSITHVGFCLNDKLMLEAGGGDHTCTTKDIAAIKGAFVKMRPIAHRKDIVCYRRPPYSWKD